MAFLTLLVVEWQILEKLFRESVVKMLALCLASAGGKKEMKKQKKTNWDKIKQKTLLP